MCTSNALLLIRTCRIVQPAYDSNKFHHAEMCFLYEVFCHMFCLRWRCSYRRKPLLSRLQIKYFPSYHTPLVLHTATPSPPVRINILINLYARSKILTARLTILYWMLLYHVPRTVYCSFLYIEKTKI